MAAAVNTRPPIDRVAAWRPPTGKKVYASRKQAYYALAKELVVAKYPAWITSANYEAAYSLQRDGLWPDDIHPPITSFAQARLRHEKAWNLFVDRDTLGNYVAFESRKWVAFVRRVARFLEWVDGRRSIEQRLAHLPPDALEARAQECERLATEFMQAAQYYLGELNRRGPQ